MGNPVFKFTLTHASLGSMVISEPDGWKDIQIRLERHPEFHSLVEYLDGTFIFYGENNIDNGGADFIRQVENLFGHDAKLEILIQADIDGDGTYEETIFNGLLDLEGIKEVFDNKIQVPIIRDDMWSKFIARKDAPVNLQSPTDLDGNAVDVIEPIDINLPSQRIRKRYHAYIGDSGISYAEFTNGVYYQTDFNDVRLIDELKEVYTIPRATSTDLPAGNFIVEYGGGHLFEIRIIASTFTTLNAESVKNPTDYIDYYIRFNNETPIAFSHADETVGAGVWTVFTYNADHELNANTEIRIYGIANTTSSKDLNILGGSSAGFSGDSDFASYCKITARTTYPSSDAQGYLIHDAAAEILKRIC